MSIFCTKFWLLVEIYQKTQIVNLFMLRWIYWFVSSYVSICILLKFIYSKFQLSNSIKWQSYWYINLGHLLTNTLYFEWCLNKNQIFLELELDFKECVNVCKCFIYQNIINFMVNNSYQLWCYSCLSRSESDRGCFRSATRLSIMNFYVPKILK